MDFNSFSPNTGLQDIVSDYVWTLNTSKPAKEFVPRITVKFKQQTSGQLTQGLNRWFEAAGDAVTGGGVSALLTRNAYEGMYLANDVGEMVFPFFSSEFIALNQSFVGVDGLGAAGGAIKSGLNTFFGDTGRTINQTTEAVGNAIGGAAAAATPGILIEKPGVWASTSPTNTTFSFYLYNTLEQSIPGSIAKNKKLVDTLIFLNSIEKIGPALLLPPVLCEYDIPGVKYGPVASMSLNIQSIGQLTFKDKKNVPDAYLITITLNDLLVRSRNMHGRDGPQRVNVFSSGG